MEYLVKPARDETSLADLTDAGVVFRVQLVPEEQIDAHWKEAWLQIVARLNRADISFDLAGNRVIIRCARSKLQDVPAALEQILRQVNSFAANEAKKAGQHAAEQERKKEESKKDLDRLQEEIGRLKWSG